MLNAGPPINLFLLLLFCHFATSCTQGVVRDAGHDSTYVQVTYPVTDRPAPFILDSADLRQCIDMHPAYATYADAVNNFYRNRSWHVAWYGRDGIREHAGFLLRFLETTGLDGIRDTYPSLSDIQQRVSVSASAPAKPDLVLEALLTLGFFWYSDRAWSGLPEQKSRSLGWFLPRSHVNMSEWLDSALTREPDRRLITRVVYKDYYRLRRYLGRYDSIARSGGWPSIPAGWKKMGADSLHQLVARSLKVHGDFSGDTETVRADSLLESAIRNYRLRHGLSDRTGIDDQLVKSLNIPVEGRMVQLMVNMERCRWMPSDLPDSFLLVNIPDFHLYAVENGREKWRQAVVVGKQLHETAVFTGRMEHVVFNPYWVIPEGILYKETLPDIVRNPSIIRKQHLEVVDFRGRKVNASAIRWSDYLKGGFPYVIRQQPGPGNALGRVKFIFPNSFSIYLHDTPSRGLFKQEKRAFSHGCIRLSDPEKLAVYLLSDEGWTPAEVTEAMRPGSEKWVKLRNGIRVYVVYLTAWVDDKGCLQFRDDVYGRDIRLKEELVERR